MNDFELKKKEFKRTVKANMIASLRLEGIIISPNTKLRSISELKTKYSQKTE